MAYYLILENLVLILQKENARNRRYGRLHDPTINISTLNLHLDHDKAKI